MDDPNIESRVVEETGDSFDPGSAAPLRRGMARDMDARSRSWVIWRLCLLVAVAAGRFSRG